MVQKNFYIFLKAQYLLIKGHTFFSILDKALAFLLANIWSWQSRESDYSKMAEAEALLASMMSEIFIPLIYDLQM